MSSIIELISDLSYFTENNQNNFNELEPNRWYIGDSVKNDTKITTH